MEMHARLARVVREILRETYASIDDQADAIVAAVMTAQREEFMSRILEGLTQMATQQQEEGPS